MTFSWEINFGHVLTFVGGLFAIGSVYVALVIQIQTVDTRTTDYAAIRDLTKANALQVGQLTNLNATLTAMQIDISAIKATLAATQGRP